MSTWRTRSPTAAAVWLAAAATRIPARILAPISARISWPRVVFSSHRHPPATPMPDSRIILAVRARAVLQLRPWVAPRWPSGRGARRLRAASAISGRSARRIATGVPSPTACSSGRPARARSRGLVGRPPCWPRRGHRRAAEGSLSAAGRHMGGGSGAQTDPSPCLDDAGLDGMHLRIGRPRFPSWPSSHPAVAESVLTVVSGYLGWHRLPRAVLAMAWWSRAPDVTRLRGRAFPFNVAGGILLGTPCAAAFSRRPPRDSPRARLDRLAGPRSHPPVRRLRDQSARHRDRRGVPVGCVDPAARGSQSVGSPSSSSTRWCSGRRSARSSAPGCSS